MYHGKGKNDTTKSAKVKNMACHYSGKMGHLRADCRNRVCDEGKGGGEGNSGAKAVLHVSQPAAAGSISAAAPKTSVQQIGFVGVEWVSVMNAEPADPADDEQQLSMVGDGEAALVDSGCARSVRQPRGAAARAVQPRDR